MRGRSRGFWAAVAMLAAVVLQTTLFGVIRPFGVAPDLVIMTGVLAALFLAAEPTLILGFAGGLVMDLLGSTVVGLRALVLTIVAYAAVKTVQRVEGSSLALAVWVAGLTAAGVVLFLLLGTLLGQIILSGGEVVQRALLVPLYNGILTLMISPWLSRVGDPWSRGRF